MNESNLLEKAYVYVGDSASVYKPMLVKLSECNFHIDIIENHPYLCCFDLKHDASFDKILDPNDISKTIVDDIADLRCSSIYELLIELHLLGALMFYESPDVSEQNILELNGKIRHLEQNLLEAKNENEMLKNENEMLKKQIEDLQKQIEDLQIIRDLKSI